MRWSSSQWLLFTIFQTRTCPVCKRDALRDGIACCRGFVSGVVRSCCCNASEAKSTAAWLRSWRSRAALALRRTTPGAGAGAGIVVGVGALARDGASSGAEGAEAAEASPRPRPVSSRSATDRAALV